MENYVPKGYERNEVITRTTSRQTSDGKSMFLATTKRCQLDLEGNLGPYVLVVVDGEEHLEFKILKDGDDSALRRQFRQSLPQGREMSVDEVVGELEFKYQSLS